MNCSARSVRGLIWLLILSISAFAHAANSAPLEGREIDFLIAVSTPDVNRSFMAAQNCTLERKPSSVCFDLLFPCS